MIRNNSLNSQISSSQQNTSSPIATFLSHHDITGIWYTHEKIKRNLQDISLIDCLRMLSKIILLVDTEGIYRRKHQNDIVDYLFAPEIASAIKEYPHDGVVFTEQQIHGFIKLAAEGTPKTGSLWM